MTEEECSLCARQFVSMPTMVRIMAGAGRLPGRAKAAGMQAR